MSAKLQTIETFRAEEIIVFNDHRRILLIHPLHPPKSLADGQDQNFCLMITALAEFDRRIPTVYITEHTPVLVATNKVDMIAATFDEGQYLKVWNIPPKPFGSCDLYPHDLSIDMKYSFGAPIRCMALASDLLATAIGNQLYVYHIQTAACVAHDDYPCRIQNIVFLANHLLLLHLEDKTVKVLTIH